MSFRHTVTLPPNIPNLVAEMGVRSAIRHYLRPGCSSYVLAIRLYDPGVVATYKSAAQTLLQGQLVFGRENDYVSVVDMTTSNTVSAGSLSQIARAILLYSDDTEIQDDLGLVIDERLILKRPSPEHFEAAAKTLRLPIRKAEAEFLAGQSLVDIGTVSRTGRPVHRIVRQLMSKTGLVKGADEPLPPPETIRGRRLEDLSGYGAAKDWGLRLVSEIDAWKRGDLGWMDIDKGALINGPPGCGKTGFATALANSCGVTLINASYALWQAEGHLGDMLKAMKKTFAQAFAARPCILFIDEVDSFGDRDASSAHTDYKRQVINALLECLDPADGREGVVVVGATNSAESVDRALLRPGRLERVIDIPPLDDTSRAAVLRYHLGGADLGDLSDFIRASEGWSGARIEIVAREARRAARIAGRPVGSQDITAALPPQIEFTEEQRRRLAVHETGHAIVGHVLRPDQLIKVRINRGTSSGSGLASLGRTEFRDPGAIATAGDIANTIAILMGGVAAEREIFGEHSTGAGGDKQADLSRATDIATMMERNFGFGDNWLTDTGSGERPLENLRLRDADLKQAVARRLDREFGRASEILRAQKSALQHLSAMLSDRLELDAALVKAVCEGEGASR
ncbi:AAA family ATPase [Rhizobium leguminosarum]|uniref:AAA family ATPase n=1 Tax=Rhizobium leguminosarum TaxID=384 RepID=UPI001C973B1D|nr:AAA family ATPase [Rhizobium leguminosarum]MBY5441781.1 AAA family ATPase [Rhizobium leguminosarum]